MGQAKLRGTREERVALAQKKASDELTEATLAAVNKVAEAQGHEPIPRERIADLSDKRKASILTGARRTQFRMGGIGLAASSILAATAIGAKHG